MKNLFKYTLTLLLSATILSLPVIHTVHAQPDYYYIYGVKIPHQSVIKNYLVNNESENLSLLLTGEINSFNAPGLETLFSQNNTGYKAEVYITDTYPGNPKAVITPTGVVIVTSVIVLGIACYCVYKVFSKLDGLKTNVINSDQRGPDINNEEASMILPPRFKLVSRLS